MSQSNKDLVKKAHALLKEQGHNIPLGHVYELMSKLGGQKDWNTAKVISPNLQEAIFRKSNSREGWKNFWIRVQHNDANQLDETEIVKEYIISAPDEAKAREWMTEYVLFASGDDKYYASKKDFSGGMDINLVKDPDVRRLIEVDLKDDADNFEHQGWRVTAIPYLHTAKVVDVWETNEYE